MKADEETSITDIEIGSDGRIYIFGASREILELIRDLGFGDEHLRLRLDAMNQAETNNNNDNRTHSGNAQ